METQNENFEFLIEAGCGTSCDSYYKATRYILNTKTGKLYREETFVSETYCVQDEGGIELDCKKCSKDFTGESLSTTILKEIDYNGKVINTVKNEEILKK